MEKLNSITAFRNTAMPPVTLKKKRFGIQVQFNCSAKSYQTRAIDFTSSHTLEFQNLGQMKLQERLETKLQLLQQKPEAQRYQDSNIEYLQTPD